jgi:hypothetical protein
MFQHLSFSDQWQTEIKRSINYQNASYSDQNTVPHLLSENMSDYDILNNNFAS